jgi:pentose-5-phosphate-3-epimerase
MQQLHRKCMVGPSILSADFAFLFKDCQQMVDIGAETLHIDIMDGFDSNYTVTLCPTLPLELQ